MNRIDLDKYINWLIDQIESQTKLAKPEKKSWYGRLFYNEKGAKKRKEMILDELKGWQMEGYFSFSTLERLKKLEPEQLSKIEKEIFKAIFKVVSLEKKRLPLKELLLIIAFSVGIQIIASLFITLPIILLTNLLPKILQKFYFFRNKSDILQAVLLSVILLMILLRKILQKFNNKSTFSNDQVEINWTKKTESQNQKKGNNYKIRRLK